MEAGHRLGRLAVWLLGLALVRSLELISPPPSMHALREALLASLIDPLRESPAPTLVDSPPRGLRGAHTDLSSALRDEYVAESSFCRALVNADSAGAQAAYGDLTSVRTRLRATITDIRKAASGAMRVPRRSGSTV